MHRIHGLGGHCRHELGGIIPVGAIFKTSVKIGQARAKRFEPPSVAEVELRVLS